MNLKFLFSLLTVVVFATAPLCRAASDDTVLLSTLGYTTGQSVLLTHLAVGTLADAYVNKAYKAEQATTGMKNQLKKLLDENTLSKNDSQFVQNTIDVLDLVLGEANDLKDYIKSGKQADAQTYDSSRKKAWKEIKTLLSIKD
jgi:phosphopentomutase